MSYVAKHAFHRMLSHHSIIAKKECNNIAPGADHLQDIGARTSQAGMRLSLGGAGPADAVQVKL